MSQERILLFQDGNNGNIVRYKCIKREVSPLEVDCFFSSLYGMKLNSSEVNSTALKDGATTKDVINALRNILEDEKNPIIDFQGVVNLFNIDSIDFSVVTAPIQKFLNLYDVNKDREYSPKEWTNKVQEKLFSSGNSLVLRSEGRETQSIKANSKILQNINLRNYVKRK